MCIRDRVDVTQLITVGCHKKGQLVVGVISEEENKYHYTSNITDNDEVQILWTEEWGSVHTPTINI